MASLESVLQLPNGARFYRADLHIHSFGGSHDVKDKSMTPTEIVETAVAEGLSIIAITDHNETKNVVAALEAAPDGLMVIPGVELSTPQGHLLCYLPTLESLEKFFGRLTISDRGKATSNCQQAIPDCLATLVDCGGFGILAHVDGHGGFESVVPGGSTPHRRNVICHGGLLGIEVRTASSPVFYSPEDSDTHRSELGKQRIKALGLGSSQFLARVVNSDAHTVNALGRNASGDRKVTRLKMDTPSFDAVRIALRDADARVRIEEQIPDSIPHVKGIAIEGGFLDGVQIHLSQNLNCIIGGRGTGKSTTFEAVACLIGDASPSEIVDSEIWPDKLDLFWQDQAGQQHSLERRQQGQVINLDDTIQGPSAFEIECYRQGETARIRSEAQHNPIALLSYLDRFIDLKSFSAEEETARSELLELQGKIEEARKQVQSIPATEQDLKTKEKQLEALERANAKHVIALQRKLEGERAVRAQIAAKVTQIKTQLANNDLTSTLDDIQNIAEPSDLVVGSADFAVIVAKSKEFKSAVATATVKTGGSFDAFRVAVDASLFAWKTKEASALRDIEEKKKELIAHGIKLDMAYISKLAKDEAQLKANLKTLQAWKPHLKELERKYAAACKRRWAARDRIAAARTGYAKQTSATLASVLEDLSVSLKFIASAYSPDAEAQIIAAMSWRTSQVPRARLMLEQLTLQGLLQAIDSGDAAKIASVKTPEGTQLLSGAEATRVISALKEPAVRFALDRAELYDLPRLIVTAYIKNKDGKVLPVTREFRKLSFGQQQSVLLALMLSSKSNAPLIIDQPEDNLDGEFIYKTLVPVLRLAKERRQIVVVTHNANIAVLGDAEQIIVLKSTNEKGRITTRGSIDQPATRDAACAVLEGHKEAFRRRAEIYGVI